MLEEQRYREVHRGEVYYYTFSNVEGSEIAGGRPCVIVSNEKNNENAPTVTVIPLTTQDKPPLPTHVYVDIGSVHGLALAEQVTTIAKRRLSSYCGEVDEKTRKKIDAALAVQLELSQKGSAEIANNEQKIIPPPVAIQESAAQDKELLQRLILAEHERNTYRELYNSLLEKVIGGTRK